MTNRAFAMLCLAAFLPLTAAVLYCDSNAASSVLRPGQFLSNVLAALYLAALIRTMRPQRRLLALLFVPLSAVGEVVFTLLFGLYHYRLGAIPVYVPLGHSILLSVGLLSADHSWARIHRRMLQHSLLLTHGLLIAGAWLLYSDTLSAVLALPFALILITSSSRSRTTYLIIGALVLYVELLGTMWGCWTWQRDAFGIMHTVNPPPGAFACYVIGEVIAVRVAAIVADWWARQPMQGMRLKVTEAEVCP